MIYKEPKAISEQIYERVGKKKRKYCPVTALRPRHLWIWICR